MKFHVLVPVDDSACVVMTFNKFIESSFYGVYSPREGHGHFARFINHTLYEDKATDIWDGPPKNRYFTHITWYPHQGDTHGKENQQQEGKQQEDTCPLCSQG